MGWPMECFARSLSRLDLTVIRDFLTIKLLQRARRFRTGPKNSIKCVVGKVEGSRQHHKRRPFQSLECAAQDLRPSSVQNNNVVWYSSPIIIFERTR